MRDFDNFNRKHDFLFNFIKGWFVMIGLALIIFWFTLGYSVYTVATQPEIVGRTIGKAINGFEEVRK